MNICLSILISVYILGFCRGEYHCKPKPGCQIARCDPSPWLQLEKNEFPITCENDDTQKVKEQENEIFILQVQLREYKSEMEEYKSQVLDLKELTATLTGRIEKLETESRGGTKPAEPHPATPSSFDSFTTKSSTVNRGIISPWTDWAPCSATCGSGTAIRFRFCNSDQDSDSASPSFCGDFSSSEVRPCTDGPCSKARLTSWGAWSSCDVTCGEGIILRTRRCVTNEGIEAPESCGIFLASEAQLCNLGSCYQFTPWGDWSPCRETCGPSISSRTRRCVDIDGNEALNIFDCDNAISTESKACNAGPCYDFTEWSSWTPCSKSCGVGVIQRERQCVDYQGIEARNIAFCDDPDNLGDHEADLCDEGDCSFSRIFGGCRGIRYRGTCYFAILREVSSRNKGLASCSEAGARLANIIDEEHQKVIRTYMGKLIDEEMKDFYIWIAPQYDPSSNTVTQSNGRVVSSLPWLFNEPIGNYSGMLMVIRKDAVDILLAFLNQPEDAYGNGVLCEI